MSPPIKSSRRSGVSPARRAAFQVLLRVETRDSYASELLHSELLQGLSAPDKALATELVMGTLRWQSALDRQLSATAARNLKKSDVEVRIALRLGAYQLLYLEKIPAHAAVDESVELVKMARKRSAAPFVNAVLRKLAATPLSDSEQTLAARYAHPEWLIERWSRNFGEQAAERICRFDQERPRTAIWFAGLELEKQIKREGIELAPGELVLSARRVVSGDITQTRAWRERRIFIQDEASQLVALLLGRGVTILDCCAAPGGKTAAIAARHPGAAILATELHLHRAQKMAQLTANPRIQIVAADAQQLPFEKQFDRILADLPCSGTGTLARNPEIKWRLCAEDIRDLQRRQINIVNSVAQHLTPGGRLLYSTCSLEPEEGEAVIDAVISQKPKLRVLPMRAELEKLQAELAWRDLDSLIAGNYLRTLPGTHPCDGFFAALVERIG